MTQTRKVQERHAKGGAERGKGFSQAMGGIGGGGEGGGGTVCLQERAGACII